MGDPADLNLFMMCDRVVESELTTLPPPYVLRSSRPDELDVWKSFPFDDPEEARHYDGFMSDFFDTVYRERADEFFDATRFVCDPAGTPIATCALWRAYGELTTVHWFKVRPSHEGRGIGRALLSTLLRTVADGDRPIYLHTQPGSFRAVKLYSDLGFRIITNDLPGPRPNDHVVAMRELERHMPRSAFERLETTRAPRHFEDVLARHDTIEF